VSGARDPVRVACALTARVCAGARRANEFFSGHEHGMPKYRFRAGATVLGRVVCGVALIFLLAFSDLCVDKHMNKKVAMQGDVFGSEKTLVYLAGIDFISPS